MKGRECSAWSTRVPAHVGQTKAYKIIIMLSTASTPLVLLACLVLIVAQDASNTNQESSTIPIEDKGFQDEDQKHDIDGISRVMELTDIQFQEVLDKSINASSYVFAKVFFKTSQQALYIQATTRSTQRLSTPLHHLRV